MSACRFSLFQLIVLLFLAVNSILADVPASQYSPEQIAAIHEARIRVSEIRNAEKDGDISPAAAKARVKRIIDQLNAGLATGLTEAALMAINTPGMAPQKTTTERMQSFFEGINFLRLGLIAVFTILTILLIGRHLIFVLRNLPKEIWDIIVYAGGIALLAAQATGLMVPNQFWAFFGCLLIAGGLGLTFVIHNDYLRMERVSLEEKITPGKVYLQYVCPAIMLVAFSISALITGSVWMGAFATLSLMALLGFSGAVIPFGYAVGFRDDDALARATSTGLIVMTLFMVLHAVNFNHPNLRVFETGSLIVGGFVGYLGLLIAGSNRYMKRLNWLAMQAMVLFLCFAGVFCASLLGMSSVQIIAGSFLTLWTIEKMVEIPGDGFVPWVLKLMAASGVLYLMVTYGAPLYAEHLMG